MPAWREQLGALDAAQPWLAPYADRLGACRQAVGQGADAAAALSASARSAPASSAPPGADDPAARAPRFVAAGQLPAGEAYEAFIARTATVPTRDNLHDFFNGLVWLRFPQAKRRLSALQAVEISRSGVGPVRGAVRDALTLFDENGALLDAPDPLWQALLERDWRRLFVELRPLWRQAHLLVFGHALLEKLVYPRKELTAHVWRAQVAIESIADGPLGQVDRWLADSLTAPMLAGKPFTPLPVLGVPGWWPGNEDFSFYDDSLVFRPRRRQNA
jgi:hypothetical protein